MKLSNLLLITLSLLIIVSCQKEEKPNYDYSPEKIGIEFTDCQFEEEDYNILCGFISVPENRESPNSRLISLPFKVIKSPSKNPAEPIFYLAGGPGGSNLTSRPNQSIIENHDYVLIGYRGVDGMSRLNCDNMFQTKKGEELYSEKAVARMTDKVKNCAETLESQGFDLTGYNMVEVIDDIEFARKQLGYDKVHLRSGSYGTRLAQIYAYRYPESISRSLMVAVNPPGHFVWEPETLDRQIEYYSDLCKKDPYCSGLTDDLATTVKNVMHNMPKKWLFFPIERDKVRMATFMGLYHRESAASVFDMFIKAEKGDASGLALASMAFGFQIGGMDFAWGDSFAKAFPDFDPKRNYQKDMGLNESIMGSPGSQFFGSMKGWPGKDIDEEYKTPQESAVDMLLVGGSIDFSTPVEFARDKLMKFYSNAKQVILSEFGHTGDVAWYKRDAYLNLAKQYYDSGVVDDSQFEYEKMNFEPSIKFAKMAKIGVATGIGMILLLILFIWWIVRKIKKRKLKRRSVSSDSSLAA
jgi:pimeloyl-ACP methyl ester carboxylesterase